MDRFPQILTASTGLKAVDDYEVTTITLPRPLFGTSAETALVMEFLWVDFYMNIRDTADTNSTHMAALATTTLGRTDAEAATLTTISDDMSDPSIIAAAVHARSFTTSGATTHDWPIRMTLTDGNGNGVLVATSRLFLVSANTTGTTAADTTVKIGYRQVAIGSIEYAGIIQGQISGT